MDSKKDIVFYSGKIWAIWPKLWLTSRRCRLSSVFHMLKKQPRYAKNSTKGNCMDKSSSMILRTQKDSLTEIGYSMSW